MASSNPNVDNPFDVGRDLLKSLQGQVHDMQMALRQEQHERKVDVEQLQAALAREITQRSTHLQQMEQSLSQESEKLDRAQHRLRLDVGDLRAAVKKVSEDEEKDARDIRQELCTEVVRLTSALQGFRSDHEADVERLNNALAAEIRSREADTSALSEKCDKLDVRLSREIATNLRDFEEYRDAMQADYGVTKQSTSHLIQDVDWMATQLRGAGLTAELYKQLQWESVGYAGPPLDRTADKPGSGIGGPRIPVP